MNTIPEMLVDSVTRYPDRIALRLCGQSAEEAMTYSRLAAAAWALGNELTGLNIEKGQKVALLCENRPEWGVAYFAIHAAGAVLVPIDPMMKGEEIAHILERSGARRLMTSELHRDKAAEASSLANVPLLMLEKTLSEADTSDYVSPEELLAAAAGPDDLAVLSFTSGTTGVSKGIMLTHRNLTANVRAAVEWSGVNCRDHMISILPLNHMFEQTVGLLLPIAVGGCVSYPGSMNPRVVLGAMSEAHATVCIIVPALARLFQKKIQTTIDALPPRKRMMFRIAQMLVKLGAKCRLRLGRYLLKPIHSAFGGQMKFMVSGGAVLDNAVAEFFRDVDLPLFQGYGLSEASPIVSANFFGQHRIGSVGRPLGCTRVRIAESDGTEGEILLLGDNIMSGYFEAPEATAEAFDGDWFRTGDLGYLDKDGFLFICGRAKDLIVGESGKNIYPPEIEAELEHSDVFKVVCVMGVVGDRGVEEIAAIVQPDEEALGEYDPEVHDEQFRDELRRLSKNLSDYKRPKKFAVWPGELPRTTTLKIKKHEVRKHLAHLKFMPL